ncbi:ImmA/IrrE family metallo-endopeptidase [Hathewaya histolytica]|uniref:Gp23-like protein n=1 Tax=Hathewaya histolytica TaxID=1498 RepID=A0A4U9RNT4_HATHI|nr:ImmA/IrrE family metallo-endopeptidase [Hathewaya histolytica]VTQ93805.1 gp23-like protein [Hathewaya histolytica]
MNYNALLEEAIELNIQVKEIDLKTKDGLCKGNRIAISKRLKTDKERCCVLVEELGHFHKTVGDITDQSKIQNRKQEYIARKWGYERLVGIKNIIKAFENGAHNSFDMAEYLNITEEFLKDAISYYKAKYGVCCEIDNYIIYFEPCLGIIKIF